MFPPNSMLASISSTPAALTPSAAKNPPPPNMATVTRNGCSRDDSAKRRPAGLPTNGSDRAAESDRFCSEKMPTPVLGMPTLNPDWMPSGVTEMAGGSLNPSAGSSPRMVSTKASAPMNSSPTPSAATSGFRPGSDRKVSRPIDTRTTPASVREKPLSSPLTVVSGPGPPPAPRSWVTVRTSRWNLAPRARRPA